MFVRAATSADAAAIRSVHLQAFPTAFEADLVEQLERDGDAAISLVADDGGEVVGHVLFSRMQVEGDGRALSALGLAPVAVVAGRQGQGVGSALIRAGLDEAKLDGAEIVFVLGEPDYYGRFGFTADAVRPFDCIYAGDFLQAVALGNCEPPRRGTARYAKAFKEPA